MVFCGVYSEEITLLYRKEKDSFFNGKQSKVVRVHNLGPSPTTKDALIWKKENTQKKKGI